MHGLPLFHVHGLILGVLGALRIGGRVIHTGRPTPAAYAAAATGGGTLFFGVPTVWSRLAAEAKPRPLLCAPPACWCPAAPACRLPCSSACWPAPVTRPSSVTG